MDANVYIIITGWSAVVGMRQAAESSKEKTTADFRRTVIRVYFAADNFPIQTKWSLARIDNSAARAAKKTRSRDNQIGPLVNKMDILCFLGLHEYNFLNNN